MSTYFDKTGLSVSDGGDAVDSDINNFVDETDAAFDQVQQDMLAAIDSSEKWAETDPYVPVEPGKYSSKHYAQIGENWAVGTPTDNTGAPTGDQSSKKEAEDSAASAVLSSGYANDSNTSRGQAEDQADRSESEADKAQEAADLSYQWSLDAQSVVTQDLTSINKVIDSTPNIVDVFIYDTYTDSDGGNWRKRCDARSWYNEPLGTSTRGLTKEFPALALVVAEVTRVTIYDATDPNIPMWMVFNGGSNSFIYSDTGRFLSAVSMLNGVLVTSNSGVGELITIDFIKEEARSYTTTAAGRYSPTDSSLVNRNSLPIYGISLADSIGLADRVVYDVDMVVSASTPVDQTTGIRVPTIVAGTGTGVSVVDDGPAGSGSVVNIDFSSLVRSVSFNPDGRLFVVSDDRYISSGYPLPTSDVAGGTWRDAYYDATTTPATLSNVATSAVCSAGAHDIGLTLLKENPMSPTDGMVGYLTPDYFSGWMQGDIKIATLADTVEGALGDGTERVTNGTFTEGFGGTEGWTATNGALISASAGVFTVKSKPTGGYGNGGQGINVVEGKTYEVSVDYVGGVDGKLLIGTLSETHSVPGTYKYTFIANGSFISLTLQNDDVTPSETASWANVSVKEIHVLDRSVNGNPLEVVGSIDRVRAGVNTDLVVYEGFSVSDYIEGTNVLYADTLYLYGWEYDGTSWNLKSGIASTLPMDGVTVVGTTLKIEGTYPKALIRLTSDTPSAEQLQYIYEQERMLFEDYTEFILPTDSVDALSCDNRTGKLAVLCGGIGSVYTGLTRPLPLNPTDDDNVLHPITSPGVSIAIHKGTTVTADSGMAFLWKDAFNLREELEKSEMWCRDLPMPYISAGAAQTVIQVPLGYEPVQVFDAGILGTFTTTTDGFYKFANIPSSTGDVTVMIMRGI
jgi:hypothetical protein